jgi:hypothetical protein
MDVEIKSNIENLELYSDNYPFRLSLRIRNFPNESDYKKFIKNCESIIRRSIEYKYWVSYIKDILQIDRCMITHERNSETTIEVHHHIPSLFVLITSIVNKNIEEDREFCTFDICQEAIQLHYQNKVGYVTLLSSMHEKFHNGCLDIPIEFVRGDYKYYIDNYRKFIDESDMEKIENRLVTNGTNCSWTINEYPGAKAFGGK